MSEVERPGLRHIAEWLDHKIDQLEPHAEENPATQGSYDAYTVARGMVGLAIHYPEQWMERHERLMAKKTTGVAHDGA